MASLDSVRQKIVRAKEHLQALEGEALRYFASQPGEVVAEEEPETYRIVLKFNAKTPVPTSVPLILGDCIQNLRSSLDYLVWELVLAANETPDIKNMFPICSTQGAFQSQIARHRLRGVAADAVEEIERLQPYHYGQKWETSPIQVLDTFCNINKHRRLLLTVLAAHAARTEFLSSESGHHVHSTLTPSYDGAEVAVSPKPSRAGEIMEVKGKCFLFITFDERPAKGIEVSSCLFQLWNFVDKVVVSKFERFFV